MKKVRIIWDNGVHAGIISALNAKVLSPAGRFVGEEISLCLDREQTGFGANTTLVHVQSDTDAFSFFLRDVFADYPMYIPFCHAIVTEDLDRRSFFEIAAAIRAKGRKNRQQQIEEKPEYCYEQAARETRDLPGPAWLGISKDFRYFEVGMRSKACGNDEETYDYIRPRFHDALRLKEYAPAEIVNEMSIPEMNGCDDVKFGMMTGRGLGCRHQITRRLEEGYMPILNAWNEDEGIHYSQQYFATLERSPMTHDTIRGSDMYAAHGISCGHNLTPEQSAIYRARIHEELVREEETVLYIRVVAENKLGAPAYAFVYAPNPLVGWDWHHPCPDFGYDEERGYLYSRTTGRVLGLFLLEGQAMPQQEMSVLLRPGEKVIFEFRIPHRPIERVRADALREQCYDARFAEAKTFWSNELTTCARVALPEKRIEEMIKAGLMHIDIGYFGKNPDEAVVPIVGVYTGIGSESSPGIQFLDFMGNHSLAERAIQFFLNLQRENGFMQNHGGYMLETGCVLWTMGEHFRMTRDLAWVRQVHDKVVLACDYLITWRHENMNSEAISTGGYGMISGRVSDPMDFFHSFMLNAGTFAGLSRAAELLNGIDPENAERIQREAESMRADIRRAYVAALSKSPVLPAQDGTWYPATAPWTEYAGPLMLYAEGGQWYSHASFTGRDQEGAVYLLLHEVIRYETSLCENIMRFYTEMLMINNTGFSQSYYSPHPYVHALRGEVKPFLMEFYSGFASLSDRETYSFWEHYFHASQHKLHEEAWFLMRCRWMLCLEDYEKRTLRLLSMIPRRWMRDGETIDILGMRSYYGAISCRVESKISEGRIHVRLRREGKGFPEPKCLSVRLPHPQEGIKAIRSTLGEYDPEKEAVTLLGLDGGAEFDLFF